MRVDVSAAHEIDLAPSPCFLGLFAKCAPVLICREEVRKCWMVRKAQFRHNARQFWNCSLLF